MQKVAREKAIEKKGRRRKYQTPEEAYAARLENNKKWRLAHPEQWKRIQATAYQRRKLRGYWRKPVKRKVKRTGVKVDL